ncbi:MAG TPA: hypothetical protein VNW95_09410 [Mucilaginibacter sp.]|nr:hypothetical protein [Mucilaginibacter sp.]
MKDIANSPVIFVLRDRIMEKLSLSREELYDLFWSKPLARLSDELDFSISVLRQLSLEQQIPLPWHGYWSTRPSNFPRMRTSLPEVTASQTIILSEALQAAARALRFPGETANSFLVPAKLKDADPLVAVAAKALQEGDPLYGLEGMYETRRGQLPIRVSKNNMDRALRIMDTLVKCWRRRGYEIGFADKETKVHLRNVELRISLRETVRMLPKKKASDPQRYESTGLLAFKVDGWLEREWKDGKVPLENNVAEILDHMEIAARDLEHIWVENEVRRKKDVAEQQVKAAEIRSNEQENKAFETLILEAQRWQQLRVLDDYLNELSRSIPRTPAFEEWLNWARNRRRIFDPIQQRQSSIEIP